MWRIGRSIRNLLMHESINAKAVSDSGVQPRLTVGRLVRVLLRYLPFYKPYKAELLLLFLLLPIAGSVIVVVQPLTFRMILDVAFPRKDIALLILLVLLGVSALVLERTLVVVVRNTLGGYIRARIMGALGTRFYRNMLGLNMKYHHDTSVGEKIFRCDTDVIDTAEMLGLQIPMMVQYFFQFLITLTAMCMIDYRPVLAALLCTPLFFLIAQPLYNYYRKVDLRQRILGQKLTSHLEQTLAAPAVVYSHGTRKREGLHYYRALVKYSIANMIYWFMNEVSIVLVWPSGAPALFADFIIGLYAGYLVVTGEMTVGEWSALKLLILQAIIPLGILITYYQSLRLRMVPAERILSILDLKERIMDAPDAAPLGKLRGQIEFRNVHFSYRPGKPVLQGVSFKIHPGSRVAFVGPSGIGKTTIMNLILRFYDPDQGLILIDGKDLRKIQMASYRSQIGIVLQEPVLFEGTIRENILYGTRNVSDAQFQQACGAARLGEVLQGLPKGYETFLSSGGDLALGQKQRISVARCIARKPEIVLLDEPTSLVDPPSKQAIVHAVDRVAMGRTAIFISHDLLTLKDLDCIYVLQNGQVAESGSHDALIQRKGLYYSLWNMQVQRQMNSDSTNGTFSDGSIH